MEYQLDQLEKEPEWVRLEDLDEEDIDDEFGDMVIEQRLLVNNTDALERITEDLKLDLPWIEALTVTSKEPLQVADVFDDLAREEAFYQQALEAARIGRQLTEEAGAAFFKPDNFIAPMLKDDKQMEAVRQRLLEEAKDGNEDALRRLHIFNKEQKKQKMNERAKLLMRKKKDGAQVELEDDFNLDLDEAERLAAATNPEAAQGNRPAKNYTRDTKNAKYALGKRKREGQQGGANPAKKGMSLNKKSSLKRPGKAKRQSMRK
ncbi:putative rRNA-processing protein ebp2 [Choanephora cucurbitarum]|uniref:Putative rRNA-processing protein ebp2 n=1 Tax=Choanephora cucurbitarum TaxID=101091 RepID=A0A1C7NCX1_9FUNG|nr:putative rRNA-processing protein ebp2 [Choanephora cucurbitarum]